MSTIETSAPRPTSAFAMVRRYFLILGGEAGVSVFHFLLNVKLIRTLAPADYAVFGILFLAAAVVALYMGAFSSVPLTVHVPKAKTQRQAALLEVVFGLVALGVTVVTFVSVSVLGALLSGDVRTGLWAGAFAALFALRYHLRSVFYARRTGGNSSMADLIYIFVGFCGIIIAYLIEGDEMQAATPFVLLAVACGLSIAYAMITYMPKFRLSFRRTIVRRIKAYYAEIGWGVAQVSVTTLQSQALVVLVGLFAGPSSYAALHAGVTILGPLRMVALAWANTFRPEVAALLGKGEWDVAMKRLWRSTFTGLILMCLFGLGLYLTWPFVHAVVFEAQFSNDPMGLIVALQWLAALMYLSHDNLEQFARANNDLKALFRMRVVGGLVSIVAITAFLMTTTPAHAIWGVVIGEAATLLYIYLHIRRARETEVVRSQISRRLGIKIERAEAIG